jgi:phage tail-like protein
VTTYRAFRLHITDAEGDRRTVDLAGTVTLGRQVGNDVQLQDQRVSRQHAVIACSEQACRIADLDSSNGTYLDGERLPAQAPMPLQPGHEVTIGPFTLTLEVLEIDEPAVAPSEAPEPVAAQAPPIPATAKEAEHARDEVPPEGPREPPSRAQPPGDGLIPPGLDLHSRKLLHYLPGIYHTEFMARFLGIFEAVLTPIEWNIDNFDLFLDPDTSPEAFLPWLANWFDITFDTTWSAAQRRRLLREAHKIYARRGTRWALSRVLEIYTDCKPRIDDVSDDLDPFTFRVTLPLPATETDREMVERLIDAHKPAHTMYTLEFET